MSEPARAYPLPGGVGLAGGNGRVVRVAGATVVTCWGEPECVARFITASEVDGDLRLLEEQLVRERWQVTRLNDGKICYRCPEHAMPAERKRVPLVYRGPKESPRAPGDRASLKKGLCK